MSTKRESALKETARAIVAAIQYGTNETTLMSQAEKMVERILAERLQSLLAAGDELTAEVVDIAAIPEYIPGDIEMLADKWRAQLAQWKGE